MHSVKPCLFVFDETNSWADFCSSQLLLVKKMLIAAGIGERLREERERIGLNQTDFGFVAGVSRGTQKAYELETSSPDIRYLSTLQSMDVDVLYVLTGLRSPVDASGLTAGEAKVLDLYRRMTDADKSVFERTGAALAGAAG